jgi:hypothetical protein
LTGNSVLVATRALGYVNRKRRVSMIGVANPNADFTRKPCWTPTWTLF